MIVLDRLKDNQTFSNNEKAVAQYLIDYDGDIENISTKDLAKATFTSPSTVIRLAAKVGFEGWVQLRKAIAEEKKYISITADNIHPDFPILWNDTFETMNAKMAELHSSAIRDTASLLTHDAFSSAVRFLSSCKQVYLFALGHSAAASADFCYKMRSLFIPVHLLDNRDEFPYFLKLADQKDVCLFISYSGESFENLKLTSHVRSCNAKKISITKMSDNPLVQCTDINLYLPPSEDQYEKIGHFLSNESIHYVLDMLYAGIFRADFSKNMEKRKEYQNAVGEPYGQTIK